MFFGPDALLPLIMMMSSLGGSLPMGIPPEGRDELLARVAPDECIVYISWEGMAPPDGTNGNRTEALLAEEEVQLLIAQIDQLMEVVLSDALPQHSTENELREHIPALARMLLTRPTALFVTEVQADGPVPIVQGGMVVNLGEDAAWQRAALLLALSHFKIETERIEIEGDEYYRSAILPGTTLTWGIKDNYLLVGLGEDAIESMLADMQTDLPDWLVEVNEKLSIDRRGNLIYANAEVILELVEPFLVSEVPDADLIIDSLGLGNIRYYAAVGGLDEESYVQRNTLVFDGVPRGIFAALDGESLTLDDLASVPADSLVVSAIRLDLEILFDSVVEIAGDIDEYQRDRILDEIEAWEEDWEIDLYADLLGPLGDSWCFYISPSENVSLLTGLTVVVPLNDAGQMERTIERFAARVQEKADEFVPNPQAFFAPVPPRMEKIEWAGHEIHLFHPGGFLVPYAPCWAVVGDELVLSLFPQNIKSFLNRSDDFESLDDLELLDEWFGAHDGPLTFSYIDEREMLRRIYPWVQIGGQVMMNEANLDLRRIEFDMSMLPSLPTIERHMDVAIAASYRMPDAMETKMRQTLPGNGLVALVPLWLAVVANDSVVVDLDPVVLEADLREAEGDGPDHSEEGMPDTDPFDGEDPFDPFGGNESPEDTGPPDGGDPFGEENPFGECAFFESEDTFLTLSEESSAR